MMFDLKGNKTQDVKTGETIERYKVPEDMDKKLIEKFSLHGRTSTELAGRLEQMLMHVKAGLELLDKKVKAEGDIKEELKLVCRKLQLNEVEPWGYNFQEHSMEKRMPPSAMPQGVPPPPPGGQPNG